MTEFRTFLVSIDKQSGEVLFDTDERLCKFMSEAIRWYLTDIKYQIMYESDTVPCPMNGCVAGARIDPRCQENNIYSFNVTIPATCEIV